MTSSLFIKTNLEVNTGSFTQEIKPIWQIFKLRLHYLTHVKLIIDQSGYDQTRIKVITTWCLR
jgi:hypothetical protein